SSVDSAPPDRLRRLVYQQSRNRAAAAPAELARILNALRPLFFPSARRPSLRAARPAPGQSVFPASRLRTAILQRVCSVAGKNSSLLLPSNLLLLFHSCVGARRPLLHSLQPAYRGKVPAWPEWNRPCSLFLRAGKLGEPCIE